MNPDKRHSQQSEPESLKINSDPLGLFAESGERQKFSVREVLEIIKDKLIDISPDFLISADKIIEEFEHQNRVSEDIGKQGGKLFDYLAQNALYKPNKDYEHKNQDYILPRYNKINEEILREINQGNIPKSKKIKKTRAKIEEFSFSSKPYFDEAKREKCLRQHRIEKIPQDGGINTIEETVTNTLFPEYNIASSELLVQNLPTKKTNDLHQLLPNGYGFMPHSMFETMLTVTEDGDKDIKLETIWVPKNLKDYLGTQNSESGFSASPSYKKIRYGNLTKKSGMLSLLHEISHAWQDAYHELYGVYKFDDLFKSASGSLDFIIFIKSKMESTDPNSKISKEVAQTIINKELNKLKEFGLEVDSQNLFYDDTEEHPQNTYKMKINSLPNYKQNSMVLLNFKVKSDVLKPIIEEYVAQERDAWAHAIRMLRFLRKEGVNLEPELKTLKDIKDAVHGCLETYQKDIESKIEPTQHIRKFTRGH
jgi:hypothetical protein